MHRSLFALAFLLTCSVFAQVPHSEHVVVLTLENHSYEQIIGNPDMPYYNQLASQYALADQYYATQHNSLSALMWLTTGAQVTTNNGTPEIFDVDHIARHVWKTGRTWKAYMSSMPSVGFTGYATSGSYMKRHNPFSYFADVVNSSQKNQMVPLESYWLADIAGGNLPNFSYVVPDADEDAHDGTLAMADQWMRNFIPQLLANPQFQKDGILFVVWDEGNLSPIDRRGTGGRTPTLVIGPSVKRGYKSTTYYTHQDLLRTVCEVMSLGSCPGNSQTGSVMSDFFKTTAAVSGAAPRIDLHSPTWSSAAQPNPVRFLADMINDRQASALIAYIDGNEAYRTMSGHLDTKIDMPPGTHRLTIHGWDWTGRMAEVVKDFTIVDRGSSGNCVVNNQSRTVTICSARNGATVSNPVHVVSEATNEISQTLFTEVLVDGALKQTSYGRRIDTDLTLNPGMRHLLVRTHDVDGAVFQAETDINVLATFPLQPVVTATPTMFVSTPLDGSSSSSPVHVAAKMLDGLPVSAIIVYSDDKEVYRTYSGTMDARLDLPSGMHRLVVRGWDNAGRWTDKSGWVNVSDRIESCNEYKPNVIAFCNWSTTNEVAGAPYHLAAAARRDFSTTPITTMAVLADGREVFRAYSGYVETDLSLPAGNHTITVQALDSNSQLIQGSKTITMK